METDLEWVASLSHHLQGMRAAPIHMWIRFLCANGVRALASIRVAMRVDLQAKVTAEAASAHATLAPQLDSPWMCVMCGDRFADRAGWAAHRAR